MKTPSMKTSKQEAKVSRTPEEEVRIQAAEFAWDLAIQLARLREQRDLTQAELAEAIQTKQQAISRAESPLYDGQSLRTLREIATALKAFVDVTLVPQEKLGTYLKVRYQPVLDESLPVGEWKQFCVPVESQAAASVWIPKATRQHPWLQSRGALYLAVSAAHFVTDGRVRKAKPTATVIPARTSVTIQATKVSL